jgi:uncharacterized protein (DUF305 family)
VNRHRSALAVAAMVVGAITTPCMSATAQTSPVTATVDSGRYGYTKADVAFMSGMIHHHAQALIMAGWAKSHGANPSLQIFCQRIITGQGAEIELMKRWLTQRHEAVPDLNAHKSMAGMPGMAMDSLMPGMLTPEQMKELDKAHGVEFDRLFLTGMIQHHTGAIQMVTDLFNAYGAGQDDVVFKFATGVNADQITEIDRMQQMLDALPPEKPDR